MYGTVARLRVKPGAAEKLIEFARAEAAIGIPGFIFQYVYQLDQDPLNCILVVGFTDKTAYVKNAESPEQHQRYLAFRALLDADPEWHDGEIVDVYQRSTA
ncbi:MAG TPA: antibiotic biosynthesis monooxygenase [Chloroflexota bacterium]|nr:antibiotic biosynthesis monooxygenase [Chloroflexota bacterium]